MKLKFKTQQYQEDAALSVVNCFEGQRKSSDFLHGINKEIELDETSLRENIQKVQKQSDLAYTDQSGFLNYSIEMETGTGKTYTYIKTMYELNKAYGWNKFIVMTPSVAIREGVLKSFQITEDHFQELYGKKIRYFVYNSNNSSNIANINTFAEDNNINVMIINYQAFNTNSKENRKIYEELDTLQSRRPIDVINSVNPILIIDEPQKFGEKTEKILERFKPLLILRYSATHKNERKYNMIYRLDAVDAYNQKLVKKINVKGIDIRHDKSESAYLYLDSVEISKSNPIANMEIEVKSSTGVKKQIKKFKANDNLYEISGGLEQYKGYVISEINAQDKYIDKVFFTNGEYITTGQAVGNVEENYMARIQIRETIKSHFEKERTYYNRGIKVLSLFFIDAVAKYKLYDENKKALNGEYADIFEEEYNNILNEYLNSNSLYKNYKDYLISLAGKKVHGGYFSIDKKNSKGLKEDELILVEPKINKKEDKENEDVSSDEDAFELIMKDKERLLSLEEPVRFIFSHSALREGWDNPNIFQICTLKKSNSEISKRQEIGRGLRICVNNNGDRMDYDILEKDFFNINTLTVVASESYDLFTKSLQNEIAENLSRKVYRIFDYKHFDGRKLKNQKGEEIVFNSVVMYNITNKFREANYIDENLNILNKLKEDVDNDSLQIPKGFENFETEFVNLIRKLYVDSIIPIGNESRNNIKELKPNKNFENEKFQALWNEINDKTIYNVNFDSKVLIDNVVKELNSKQDNIIPKMNVRITEGQQKESINKVDDFSDKGSIMEGKKVRNEVYEGFVPVKTKYDLVGQLTKDTNLTRHTIIDILKQIDAKVFEQYKYNPEEFIRNVCSIINEIKAITIKDGITYSKIGDKYDKKIFELSNVSGRVGDNAIELKKHIYDYLIADSKVEIDFAKQLEEGEVEVYAKLPNGFKIPTPVGDYNPDWAIVLNNKDFRCIYFIAETKGSVKSTVLRGTEDAKIECAKKHFEAVCGEDYGKKIKYDKVTSYDDVIKIII